MDWIKNLSVFVVSLVISIIFLEFGLRVLYPDRIKNSVVRDHSDVLMPRHMAGPHLDIRRNTVATFDGAGMRINPNHCNVDDNIRALIVGDSNIAGLFLDDPETIGARIVHQSSLRGSCIDIDTFGVSGFGPDQTFFAIEEITAGLVYDYVVFHIFADNDLGDLIRNKNYVNGKIENRGYCYVDKPFLEFSLIFKALRKMAYTFGFTGFSYGKAVASLEGHEECIFVRNSNSATFAQSMNERARLDWQGNKNNQRQIYMSDRYDIEFACGASQEIKAYVSEYFNSVIISMQNLSDQRGFATVYLLQPSEDDVTDNHPERGDKGCSEYASSNLVSFFSEMLVNQNIVNLYYNFLGCNKCYFSEIELGGDNHWSPYGVNLAASEVVDFILKNVAQ